MGLLRNEQNTDMSTDTIDMLLSNSIVRRFGGRIDSMGNHIYGFCPTRREEITAR